MSRRVRSLVVAAAVAAALGVGLAGCSPTVSMDPAGAANDPACAAVSVRLPDRVAGQSKRTTDAQSTAAWGSPAAVLLRCGVPPIGPTTHPCVDADGIDWVLETAPNATVVRYITYGRTPAIEIALAHRKVADYVVLADLARAAGAVTQSRKCVGRS